MFHTGYIQGAWFLNYALLVVESDSLGRNPGALYTPMPIYMLGAADPALAVGTYDWDVARLSIGYPTEGWWGQWNSTGDAWPWYCASSDGYFYHHGGGFYSLALGCTMSGGHSGGPITQVIDGTRYAVSVNFTGGFVYTCADYGLACQERWALFNMWGPPLLNTTGDFGFDDVWNATFTSSVNGGI